MQLEEAGSAELAGEDTSTRHWLHPGGSKAMTPSLPWVLPNPSEQGLALQQVFGFLRGPTAGSLRAQKLPACPTHGFPRRKSSRDPSCWVVLVTSGARVKPCGRGADAAVALHSSTRHQCMRRAAPAVSHGMECPSSVRLGQGSCSCVNTDESWLHPKRPQNIWQHLAVTVVGRPGLLQPA